MNTKVIPFFPSDNLLQKAGFKICSPLEEGPVRTLKVYARRGEWEVHLYSFEAAIKLDAWRLSCSKIVIRISEFGIDWAKPRITYDYFSKPVQAPTEFLVKSLEGLQYLDDLNVNQFAPDFEGI
jgi:hypothetical protein